MLPLCISANAFFCSFIPEYLKSLLLLVCSTFFLVCLNLVATSRLVSAFMHVVVTHSLKSAHFFSKFPKISTIFVVNLVSLPALLTMAKVIDRACLALSRTR